MLATVAATDSASTVRKKYSVFIYSEAEPHAMYAIYKQTLTLCVLQYTKTFPTPLSYNPFTCIIKSYRQVQNWTIRENLLMNEFWKLFFVKNKKIKR